MTTTPAPGARDQVARLLKLVPYLYARGTVHVVEAARTLGTTPRQLVKDLKVLLMCGLPGGYPDDLIDVDLDALEEGGDGVIRVSNADYLARPLRLTPTEASAVIVALRALRNSAGTRHGTREVLDRALAKLEAAAAHGGVDQIDPGQGVEAPFARTEELVHAGKVDEAGVPLRRRIRDGVFHRQSPLLPKRIAMRAMQRSSSSPTRPT